MQLHVRRDTRPMRFRAFGRRQMDDIASLRRVPPDERLAMKAVSAVFPFRTNNYIVERLIRWEDVPNDPMYQLTFPQRGMLEGEDLHLLMDLIGSNAPREEIQRVAREVQWRMNPHPAGQLQLNVPVDDGSKLDGIQHKYRETVLFFPRQGQTCHAYCTYCFRWPQFAGIERLHFASEEAETLVRYLRGNREITSVLITGGDPLVMRTALLRRYVEPLLSTELDHIASIRIGTKAPAYWPFRFLTDSDSDDLLRLFEEVRAVGKHLALMVHYSHPVELETPEAQDALRRIQDAGAVVRCQAPVVRHVNDDATVWSDMWRLQTRLGAVPYYMFVARDTGPKSYFEVPLSRAYRIFRDATRRLSGLGRTVRGPSMSATPGKVVVDGIAEIRGHSVFAMRFLQARDPAWVGRPFFAEFDESATWLDDLRPAFGQREFFWETELRQMRRARLGRRGHLTVAHGEAGENEADVA